MCIQPRSSGSQDLDLWQLMSAFMDSDKTLLLTKLLKLPPGELALSKEHFV